jgi:hypothetical protein
MIIPKRVAWLGRRSVVQRFVTEKLNTRHPEPVCNLRRFLNFGGIYESS